MHTIEDAVVSTQHLGMLLGEASSDEEIFHAIVNLPFDNYPVATTLMFLGIIVLLLVNKETGEIDRVALSSTELAKHTTNVSVVPFHDIKIGLDEQTNIIAQAIREHEVKDTGDWEDLFVPALSAEQARINQASAGITYSAVHPFTARNGGALIFSFYEFQGNAGESQREFMRQYTELVDKRLQLS